MIEDDYIFVQRLEKLIQKLPEIGPKQGLTQEEIDETIRKSKQYINNYYNARENVKFEQAKKDQLINAFSSLMDQESPSSYESDS